MWYAPGCAGSSAQQVRDGACPGPSRAAGPPACTAAALCERELPHTIAHRHACPPFSPSLLPRAAVTAEVEDKGDGTYHVMYTATRAGLYQPHITVGPEEHVADSPYPLRVLPAKPCTRRSVVAGAGRGAATTGAPAAFTVAAHDEFGNRWEVGCVWYITNVRTVVVPPVGCGPPPTAPRLRLLSHTRCLSHSHTCCSCCTHARPPPLTHLTQVVWRRRPAGLPAAAGGAPGGRRGLNRGAGGAAAGA